MNTETEPSTPPAETSALRSNGLGLASLIIGIIAAVLAFVPLINFGIGFVAFVGIVLGVVALFLKGRKKGVAIAGTIISVIALILSITLSLFYTASVIDAIEESTSTTVVTPDADADGSDTGDSGSGDTDSGDADSGDAGQGDAGTRDNPLPLGTTITIGAPGSPEWEVTVGPSVLNADDEVLAANMFNEPAEDGQQYALLNLDVTYVGDTSATPYFDISVSYIGADAVTYRESDTYAVAPNPFSDINELFPGGSGSGNIAIAIPSDTASEGTWRVGGLFGDDLFFAAE